MAGELASAASLPGPLEAAIKDVETRRAAASELRFAFKVRTVTSENEFRFLYDPEATEAWTLLSPETKETAKLRERMAKREEQREESADRDLLAGDLRKLFGNRIEMVENTATQRVYRFDLSEEAKIGDSARFDAAKYLTGEMAVGPGDRLLWVRFFAQESFKPALVAKIETFDLKLFYDTVWTDGPYVMVRQAMNVDGSAFFRSFAETVNTDYSGFEKR